MFGAPPAGAGVAPEPGPEPENTTPAAPPARTGVAPEPEDSTPEPSAAGPVLGSGVGSVVTSAAQGNTLVGDGSVIINTTVVTTNEVADAGSVGAWAGVLQSLLRISSQKSQRW